MSEALRKKAQVMDAGRLACLVGQVVTSAEWSAPSSYEDLIIRFADGHVLSVSFYSSEGETYLYDTPADEQAANADWRKPVAKP